MSGVLVSSHVLVCTIMYLADFLKYCLCQKMDCLCQREGLPAQVPTMVSGLKPGAGNSVHVSTVEDRSPEPSHLPPGVPSDGSWSQE